MTMTADELRTWRGFALAYARYQGSRSWHEDLADFYARRYSAYCDLLGLDVSDLSGFDTGQVTLFDRGFHDLGVKYELQLSPFDSVIYARSPLIDLIRTYDPSFRKTVGRQKELILDAMVEVAGQLWGSPRRTIMDADLAPYGVADTDEPNEWAYL